MALTGNNLIQIESTAKDGNNSHVIDMPPSTISMRHQPEVSLFSPSAEIRSRIDTNENTSTILIM